MTSKKNTPRKKNTPAPVFQFSLRRRRHNLMIHLGLDTRWLAGLLVAAAGLWVGWEPLARLMQAVARLP